MIFSLLTAKQIFARCIPSAVLFPVVDQLPLTTGQTFPLSLPPRQQEPQLTKQPNPPWVSWVAPSRCVPQAHPARVREGQRSSPSPPASDVVQPEDQRPGDEGSRRWSRTDQSTTLTNLPAKGGPAW